MQQPHSATERLTMKAICLLLLAFVSTGLGQFVSDVKITFKGATWTKYGQIVNSSDTLTGGNSANYNGNWMQEAGTLFNGILSFTPELEGAFGIGAIMNHKPQGTIAQSADVTMAVNSFVNMARVTYTLGGDPAKTPLMLDAGMFSYKYGGNIKNLGLYLLRGPVYPGILISGFETKEMLPSANMLGGHMRNVIGPYTSDLLLVSETDLYPKMDYSLIYVGTLSPVSWLEIGGGVNFHHLLPVRPGITSPSEEAGFQPDKRLTTAGIKHYLDYQNAIFVDTAGAPIILEPGVISPPHDTVWFSHKGVKLMARALFDPKPLFGIEPGGFFNKDDMKIYTEAAVIGTKNYPVVYAEIKERIPIMIGFNIPTGFLNVLALEVEYYGSPYITDYVKDSFGSPIPNSPYKNRIIVDTTGFAALTPDEQAYKLHRIEENKPYDGHADDWKWSLYAAKVFGGHFKISGQVANDHLRTGGSGKSVSFEEALTKPRDWYWMLKTTFFF